MQIFKLTVMNTSEIIVNWTDRKEKLKLKFGSLTDNDLLFEDDKKDAMLAKLQLKLGKTKEELLKIIAAL
jgi:uncharacterized protein YjbJ (UPF0337 family)